MTWLPIKNPISQHHHTGDKDLNMRDCLGGGYNQLIHNTWFSLEKEREHAPK